MSSYEEEISKLRASKAKTNGKKKASRKFGVTVHGRRVCINYNECGTDMGEELPSFLEQNKHSGPWICSPCREIPEVLTAARRLLNLKTGQDYKDVE